MSVAANSAEKRLLDAEITAALSGQSLYAGETVEQIFQSNGQTFYLENGSSSKGTWNVKQNQYCSVWPPNTSEACFDVLEHGEEIIFVSKSGEEFPMRRKK